MLVMFDRKVSSLKSEKGGGGGLQRDEGKGIIGPIPAPQPEDSEHAGTWRQTGSEP
jgi:hypothetical protein